MFFTTEEQLNTYHIDHTNTFMDDPTTFLRKIILLKMPRIAVLFCFVSP